MSRFNHLSHFEYSIAPVATLCLKSTEGVGNAFCSAIRPGSLDIQEFRQGKLLELRTRKTSRKGKRKKQSRAARIQECSPTLGLDNNFSHVLQFIKAIRSLSLQNQPPLRYHRSGVGMGIMAPKFSNSVV